MPNHMKTIGRNSLPDLSRCARHRENVPDVNIIVFNDHATTYSLDSYSTFTVGVGEEFKPADEGWGPRAVPVVQGIQNLRGILLSS